MKMSERIRIQSWFVFANLIIYSWVIAGEMSVQKTDPPKDKTLHVAGTTVASTNAPDGLMVEFLEGVSVQGVVDATPDFGWMLHSDKTNNVQTAYRILVAKDVQTLAKNEGDLWDSGKVTSEESVNVKYAGKPLVASQTYCWKVKTWVKNGDEQPWSEPQVFSMSELCTNTTLGKNRKSKDPYTGISFYQSQETTVPPVSIKRLPDGSFLADFGKVSFGYLRLEIESPEEGRRIEVALAERGDSNGVNRKPTASSVVFCAFNYALTNGKNSIEFFLRKGGKIGKGDIQPTARHKVSDIIPLIGPFRYVSVSNSPVPLTSAMINQIAIYYPFNDKASNFESSNKDLNDVWELCKYTMKATSFMGLYSAGDRERTPYEADTYLNQLSHYAVDREFTLARRTHQYVMWGHGTWPTEWKQHNVLIAWADYMYTGNTNSLACTYKTLKDKMILADRARPDGLLLTNTNGLTDIIDWPTKTERDGYDLRTVNSVVNAFSYKTLVVMEDIARVLGKDEDAADFRKKAVIVKDSFNKVFFDQQQGVYIDSEGSQHASLHANMMPLAFGLVPPERRKTVTDFVISRGMACSVYGAQYLLEALYEAGRPDVAIERMTSHDIRSWCHMLDLGSTMTLEAWDDKFKKNQDWNHAWGAAPGNIISRYLLGVRPLTPGFAKAWIQPQPASLTHVRGVVPTIRGPVEVAVENENGKPFKLEVKIPVNMTARVGLPRRDKASKTVTVDGNAQDAQVEGNFLFVDDVGSGPHVFISK